MSQKIQKRQKNPKKAPPPEPYADALNILEGCATGILMCGKRPFEERKKQAQRLAKACVALRAVGKVSEQEINRLIYTGFASAKLRGLFDAIWDSRKE